MALLLLLFPIQLLAQNGNPNLGKPAWTTPLHLSTDSGEATFEWAPKKGDVVELYRITETSRGREGIFYVDGQALDVYRVDPGDYRFSLQACNKDADGLPVCGPASRQLVLTVTAEIWANDPVNDGAATLITQNGAATPFAQNVVGGPGELRPGVWHNPQKTGQGWSLYWANRLVASSNPSIPYDLYVIWYTYEAKTRTITPICEPPQPPCGNDIEYFNYRPVVVTMNLVKSASNNNYVGAVSIKRGGTTFNVGDATVIFGAGNTSASITWSATFKKQSLTLVTDGIELLAGSSGSSSNDASHYAGLWGATSASSYIVDDVGSLSETVETIFYDGNGDPTWIQAFQGQTPLATSTSLCFYHIRGGYQPDLNQPVLPGTLYTTCDPENATSSSRNGLRYFSDFEAGRFWVNFTLPPGVVDPNQVAGGSVSIGASTNPATKTKAANFHRIWFSGSNSCQINASSPSCVVNLTWFTDGDYPHATAYRYNQATGQRSLLATSTQPAMENQQVSIAAAGSYVFELRMSNSTSSALIAKSSIFTVTQASNISPTAAFSANCTLLSCAFTDQSSDSDGSIASRAWNFGDGGTSSAQNPSHTYAAAGTYTVSLTVTDNVGASGSTSKSVTVSATNQKPVAAFSANCTNLSCAFSDQSSDSDGTIASRAWSFGDGGTSTAQNPSHTYAAAGTYTVALTVTDNQGASNASSQNVTVSNTGGQALEVFFDSFENGAWNGLWTEDAQNDWFTSTQRATAGIRSAEVDGGASDAALMSAPIDLQGHSAATVTFNWLIEFGLDAGEYLAFDVSTNGGSTWTEHARLRGNVDAENIWHPVQVDLTGLSSLRLRFRGLMSSSTEDANVDAVRVTVATAAVNQNPTAAFSASCTNLSCAFSDQSSDSDGTIASRSWTFGDGGTSTAQNPSHTYAAAGTYTVSLTVTDNQGASNASSQNVTVSNTGGQALEVFFDSFENGAWNGLWTEDAQNDWFTSTQRATAGIRSAEVDGGASDAALMSAPIDLQGHSAATVTFNWLIESGLDAGEYLAFDVSTNGGSTWTERARLRGNVDAENIWHPVQVDLTGLSSLRLRFRGLMSSSTEDANVDAVRVTVATAAVNQNPTAAFSASCTNLSCAFSDQSSDSDGTIASRAWSFGDGGTSTAQNPSHTYAAAGAYTVALTVTDNQGASNASSQSVTVSAANTAPQVTVPANQSTVQGSAITPLVIQVTDAENDPITCSVSGLPAGLIESSECTVSGTVSAATGVYTVSVTASDGQLTSAAVGFSWNVTSGGLPANPETPPAPAAAPALTPSAASSRVGASAGAFRVDESGNASYRMPLLTAPGAGGVAPQLSLEYSSQGGNGPLGVGWSLGGSSTLTRCAQTLAVDGQNAVRGITLTASDRFCLDGQRLIAVTGQYGANGTEYRTQIDPIAKIVSNGSAGSGPQSFTVWRKDGSVTQYGVTADARIEARTPSDIETVLLWAQNRVSDAAGNYIDYQYAEIGGAAGAPVEFVLDKVLYTGNTGAGTAPYAEIELIYATTRPDATVAFVAGAQVQQTRLLTRIDSRARINAGSTLDTLRSYQLAYGADGHGRKMLTAVTECRDSTQTYCFAPTTFGWQTSKHGIGSSAVSVGSLFDSNHAATTMADVTGDGRPDLLLTRNNGSTFEFRLAPALASGGFGAAATYYPIPNNGSSTEPVTLHAIDLNADGFQDVIYPTTSGWKGRLSNGGTLGSEIALGSCCDFSGPPLAQVMDFDGDGLSDVVTQRAKVDGGKELVWLRNQFSPANSAGVGFAAPVVLSIAIDANLFPQSSGAWFVDIELPEFRIQNAITKAFQRPFDYDGDGRVDLLAQVTQRYTSQCSDPSCPNPQSAASNTRVLSEFTISDAPAESPQATGSFAWASYYVVLLADGANGFVQAEVVANGDDCTVSAACALYPDLPQARRALPVDINADGLADFAWQDTAEDWSFRLNTGGGFSAQSVLIADLTDEAQSSKGVFIDLSGDGLPDFLYPSAIGSSTATWQLRENVFGAAFGAVQNTGDSFGNSAEFDQSLLLDFSGDGIIDNLFIDLNAQGAVQATSTKLFSGANVAGGATSAAVNVVTAITDGFGANTALTYKPLTDSSVYSRMRDSQNANWGGFAVYDLTAPIYVVSQAASSAPIDANPGAVSRVEYHYLGAKLQGGGRGFLGFGEIISYDPQSGIRSNTRYRQDFPFIGLPADTTQALASSGQKFDRISNTAATSPVAWGAVTATTAAAALPSGTRLSYAINAWQAIETVAAKGAWFPYIAASLERGYTLSGAFSRKVLTSNTYNNVYGNLDSVILSTYASDGATAFATQTTTNTYADDVAKWHLGRLATSAVTHARSGQSSITRSSSFGYAANGILNRETIEPGNATLEVDTTYQLDGFGNRGVTTVAGAGLAARSRTEVYDALGRYVNESRNAYGQSSVTVTQRDAFGNALQAQNIDGVITISAADFMGRPFISRTATGAWSKTTLVAGAGSNCPAAHTAYHAITSGGGQPTQYQCFDKLGREVRSATQGFNGTLIDVDTRYDASGRIARVSAPYFAGATAYWNDSAYDAIGRISAVQAADGNDLTYDYDSAASLCSTPGAARQTRTTNGLGQSQLEVRNALGETLKVIDNACGVVSSDYDATGNLTTLTGADGAQTTMSYDLAGRKTALNDPDKGAWQYAYNALGELTRQRDGNSQALDFVYDLEGRVTTRYERGGVSSLSATTYTTANSETTSWINSTSASVTGKAQPSAITYRAGTAGAIVQQQNLSYDGLGRLSLRSTSQDGLTLAEETTYDQYGRVFQQFDASGDSRGVRYHYNAGGYVEKLQEAREGAQGVLYQQVLGQDERGNTTYMILGNGVEAFAQYAAPSGRLMTLEAYDVNGVELQRVDYTFDVLGNLQRRHDTSQSQNLDETYRYDLMNRLETVLLSTAGAAAQTKLTLSYDAAGNIQSKSDVGSYLYGAGSAGPHAATSAGGITYSYDANGNQVSASDGRTISYTVFDQAKLIQKGSEKTEFSYGIANQRIKRVDDNAIDAVKTTWTFGSVERIQQDSQNAYFKRSIGGIALVDYFPATQAQDIRYLVKDHLGSIHTLTDDSGLVSSAVTMHFGAFGERQNTAWTGTLSQSGMILHNLMTTRGFTGHEHTDGLGIIHMNGRIYDPKLGRFLQADPFVQAPNNSQALNRYSYVLNNPLSYTDPSGYFSLKSLWKKVRPFVAIGIAIWNPGALWFSGVWGTAASGFLAGYVASGSLTGAVAGAFSAAAFYGIGSSFESLAGTGAWGGSGLSGEAFAVKSILHGAAGGILALGTGGKFGHGFISAGLTQAFAGRIGGLRSSFARIAAAAVLGGTSSAITGGKFANGALTGAFSRAFNDELENRTRPTTVKVGYKQIGIIAGKAWHHAFVQVVGPNGELYVIRGGPGGQVNSPLSAVSADATGFDSSAEGSFGNLIVTEGIEAIRIESGPNAAIQTILTTDRSFDSVVNDLSAFGRAITRAGIPYLPLSTNSNAFAHQAVTVLNIPRPLAPVWSPGSNFVLELQ